MSHRASLLVSILLSNVPFAVAGCSSSPADDGAANRGGMAEQGNSGSSQVPLSGGAGMPPAAGSGASGGSGGTSSEASMGGTSGAGAPSGSAGASGSPAAAGDGGAPAAGSGGSLAQGGAGVGATAGAPSNDGGMPAVAGRSGAGASGAGTGGASAGASNGTAGAASAADTWDSYAAEFFVTYCVSCHNDDNSGDATRDFHQLERVKAEKDAIACGVSKSQADWTARGCSGTPAAKQFPVGSGPKPSDAERDRLVAWIDAGMP